MTIEYRTGNLLEEPIPAIVHQANLFHIFGGGIAQAIGSRFPGAYDADKQTPYGDETKLGTFSYADIHRPFGKQRIINLYCQRGMRETSIMAMLVGLTAIHQHLLAEGIGMVGFPHGMGCGIANGNWEQVEGAIEAAFKESDIIAVIVKLPLAEIAEQVRK